MNNPINKELVIGPQKKEKWKLLGNLLIMLVLSLFLVFLDAERFRQSIPAEGSEDLWVDKYLLPVGKVAGYILLVICPLMIALTIRELVLNKNLLHIHAAGFQETMSKASVGFVPWCDVSKLEVKDFFNAKVFGIELKNPEKYGMKPGKSIVFTSSYFTDKSQEVEDCIRYYLEKQQQEP